MADRDVIIKIMKGLFSYVNWRTFLTGFLIGYIFAWKMHWATQVWSINRGWVDERIPFVTPSFGHHD